MNKPEARFPKIWDSTMIASFRACPQKWAFEHLQHWKLTTSNVHLHAGGAYAKGLEVARRSFYEEGKPEAEAIALGGTALMAAYGDFEPPPDTAKTLDRTLGAFEFYFTAYPMGSDAIRPIELLSGRRAIEFSDLRPLPIKHFDGDPILYSIRADMIGDYAGGRYIHDDKTATQLGASWSRQWDLRSQFTGYCWGANENGPPIAPVTGVIVRGVSILKTKYDTLQAITYRPQWTIDRWLAQVTRDITRAKTMWQKREFDLNLDESCNAYGGCPFKQVCVAEPKDQPQWLSMYFERRQWNPVTRTETKIEDHETSPFATGVPRL
jgi:hypothetical protein